MITAMPGRCAGAPDVAQPVVVPFVVIFPYPARNSCVCHNHVCRCWCAWRASVHECCMSAECSRPLPQDARAIIVVEPDPLAVDSHELGAASLRGLGHVGGELVAGGLGWVDGQQLCARVCRLVRRSVHSARVARPCKAELGCEVALIWVLGSDRAQWPARWLCARRCSSAPVGPAFPPVPKNSAPYMNVCFVVPPTFH